MIRTALTLAKKNLAVFPCWPRDKRPATENGCKAATTDRQQIIAWWAEKPDYNIAIATGEISNLFVIDIDGLDGELELRRLEAGHGELPATVEVLTGKGRHLYFRYPKTVVRNSVSKLAPSVDVRGSGGFVVAPPSIHPTGRSYAWSVDSASTIAEAPDWLLGKISEHSNGNGQATPSSEWHERITADVPEGARNDTLTRLTGYLLRRYVDAIVVHELMQAWNTTHCKPPLLPTDVEQIIASIAQREI